MGHRAKLMLTAIVSPEVMVIWAFRQWLGDFKVAKFIREHIKDGNERDADREKDGEGDKVENEKKTIGGLDIYVPQ